MGVWNREVPLVMAHLLTDYRRGDHYEGSSSSGGHSGEKHYNKEDSLRKIPRLNKRPSSRAPVGGPVTNGNRENTDKEKIQPTQVTSLMDRLN